MYPKDVVARILATSLQNVSEIYFFSRLELNSPEFPWSKPVRYNPLYWLVDRDPYHGYDKPGIEG